MPSPLLLRKIATVPTGYPTTGLVAYFDLIGVTGDPQTLPSLYGKSPTLQRGDTAGAEASDGSWGATGWGAVTDDYLKVLGLPSLALAGPWTLVLAGKFDSAAGGARGVGFDTAADADFVHLRHDGATANGVWTVSARAGASNLTSATLTVDPASLEVMVMTASTGVIALNHPRTGVTVGLASQAYAGTPFLWLAGGGLIAAPVDAETLSIVAAHNVALSTAQSQRAYRGMKARAATKGATIL